MTDLTAINPTQLLKFEVAFGSNPSTSSPTWTDITSQVILRAGVNMSTGKTYTDRVARPGTLSFTVDNSSLSGTEGRWSIDGPNVTSGWALRVPVRVSWITSSVTRYLWSGFVETVSSRYEAGYRPVVTINASDTLARWQRLTLPNAITAEQLRDAPAGYWPLDDEGVIATNRGSGNLGNLNIESFIFFKDGDGGLLLNQDAPASFGIDTVKAAYANTSPLGNGKYLTTSTMPDWNTYNHQAETWSFYYYQPDDYTGTITARGLIGMYGRPTQAPGSVFFRLENAGGDLSFVTYADASIDLGSADSAQTTSNSPLANKGWYHIAITHTYDSTVTSPGLWTVFVNGTQVLWYSYAMTAFTTLTKAMVVDPHLVVAGGVDNVVSPTGVSTSKPSEASYGYFSNVAYYTTALANVNLITSLSAPSSGIVTATTPTSHGYTAGQTITIVGNTGTNANGTFTILSASTTTFTFANPNGAAGTGGSAAYAPRLIEHSKLINGYAPETSDARYNRLCQYAGLSPSSYSAYTSQAVTMGAQPLNDGAGSGRSLLDLINEVALSEDGDVYCAGTGVVYFQPRSYRYNQSNAFTLPATAINADNGYDYDQTFINNDVTLTNGLGQTSHSENAASIAAYGRQNDTETIYVSDLPQLDAAARGRAYRDSTPRARLRDVTVDFVTAPTSVRANLETILNVKPTQQFQITGMPTATSPTTSLNMFVEGWSDSITEASWSRSYVASPVSTAWQNVWVVGVSQLGVNTKIAY
jgi:hypothetical protein